MNRYGISYVCHKTNKSIIIGIKDKHELHLILNKILKESSNLVIILDLSTNEFFTIESE